MQSRVGVVIGVVAVVLAIVAMIGPWWTLAASGSFGPISMTGNDDFGLFGGTSSFQMGTTSSSNTTNYANAPHVGAVFSIASILLILGLVIGIGMLLVGAMSASRPSFGRLSGMLGVLAFIVLLISSLYVMSALPDAVNQDTGSASSGITVSGFWGTKTSSFGSFASATVTWNAGWAWYVALIAAIIFLVAGILLLLARKPAMTPQAPPPMS